MGSIVIASISLGGGCKLTIRTGQQILVAPEAANVLLPK